MVVGGGVGRPARGKQSVTVEGEIRAEVVLGTEYGSDQLGVSHASRSG
jgi:hypothetical protein